MEDIARMVRELTEPMIVEARKSESTISAQGSCIHARVFLDNKVDKIEQDFELPTHEEEDTSDEEEEVGKASSNKTYQKEPCKSFYLNDDFFLDLESAPITDTWSCYFENMIEGMAKYARSFTLTQHMLKDSKEKKKAKKEIKELTDKVAALQAELEAKKGKVTASQIKMELEKKKWYDQAVNDYIYTTLTSVPSFDFTVCGLEAVEMADTFCSMSLSETQGVVRIPFPENANPATEIVEGEKVAGNGEENALAS
uniref:Uncharacterized protein n=1 Tax=Cannabis sativa TaxID=3483 RepID=A0A803Q5X3_CANSA